VSNLCVNIDHVATLRQVRLERVPDPLQAAALAEKAGAIGITAHLREDRRHIQDADVKALRIRVRGKFNLEMAATPEMVRIACKLKPDEATLVPEKRQELTTEGGLEVKGAKSKIARAVTSLKNAGIVVSLFITPDPGQIQASFDVGADFVELHTGAYARAFEKGGPQGAKRELARLKAAVIMADSLCLGVNAGHGLTYENVRPVARLPRMQDLNIGHNIVARAVLMGFEKAVREMIRAMK
jgi:pyridoxine 5-phosphate synthase